ncbi:MAG: ABC transporter permease [Thermoplasmata archaeon]
MVVGLLIALAAILQVSANTPGPERLFSGEMFYSGGQYHFDFYAFDEYGHQLAGIPFQVVVNIPNGSVVANLSGVTGSNGTLFLATTLPVRAYQASIVAGPQGQSSIGFWSGGLGDGGVSFGNLSPGSFLPLASPFAEPIDRPTGLTDAPGMLVFIPVSSACPSGPCDIFYKILNESNGPFGVFPESSMTYLGSLNQSPKILPLTIPSTVNISFERVRFEIFSSTGVFLSKDTNTSAVSLTPYASSSSVSVQSYGYYSGDMAEAVPLIAIIVSYTVYGRDRISGVLESTVVQPVTRTAIATSRYLAAVIAIMGAIGVGLLVTDLAIKALVGYYVFPSYLLSFLIGFTISVAFLVGLVFVLSHLFRSTAAVLGVVLAVYLVFTILWNSLTYSLESYLGIGSDTSREAGFQARMLLGNPMEYYNLILGVLARGTPAVSSQFGPGASPVEYGVTVPLIALCGALWAIVPLVIVLLRIRTAD